MLPLLVGKTKRGSLDLFGNSSAMGFSHACAQNNKSAKEHFPSEWRAVFQQQSFMGCAGVGEYGGVYIQDSVCLSVSLSLCICISLRM